MLQAASLAPEMLGESGELVVAFLRRQVNSDGGFKGRSAESDLYYTVFGVEALLALQAEAPFDAFRRYLATFGSGEALDLVHLACLARCWADLSEESPVPDRRREILQRIEGCRCADGGYSQLPGGERGTVYGGFLALGAYQDLQAEMPDAPGLLRCLDSLRTSDGAYANEHGRPAGSTPATAAAVSVLRHLGEPLDPVVRDWLMARAQPQGGFLAAPAAPLPDLLSTATALHALAGMDVPLDSLKEPCLDFLDSLWSSRGAFRGSMADDGLDCEYTFYGLLALGHLSR